MDVLIREAFWGYMRPTCDEHYLAHLLRRRPGFVPQLSYVALVDGALAGSVHYSRATIDAQLVRHGYPKKVWPE